MNSAWRHFNFCYGLTLVVSLGFINARSQSAPPSPANFLRLERSGTGWQLRFTLAETNGAFRIVRSDHLETLATTGHGLAIVGVAGSPRSGVISLPTVTSSPAFFGLVKVHNTLFPPPPGMVIIPAGTFVMGGPITMIFGEEILHPVTLTKDFYMSKHEVTQQEYQAVMGSNPSGFQGEMNRPVDNVNWGDVTLYCWKLNVSEQAAGRIPTGWEYRLPTEAEWEYACRAGTSTAYHYGPDLLPEMANYGAYLRRTMAVGSYQPNAFGLYDMHGNVTEWCLDWHGGFPGVPETDPRGPKSGLYRVLRGGDWNLTARFCTSAYRHAAVPRQNAVNFGFRIVLAPTQ
jgi:sulfatase modifying factor 1